jgi:hypothetical protein
VPEVPNFDATAAAAEVGVPEVPNDAPAAAAEPRVPEVPNFDATPAATEPRVPEVLRSAAGLDPRRQLIYPTTTVVELAPVPVLQPGADPPFIRASLRQFERGSGSLDATHQKERDALDVEFNCSTFTLGDSSPEDFDPERIRLATARILSDGLTSAVESLGQEYFNSKRRGSLDDLRSAFPDVERAATERLLALHASGRSLHMRPEWRPNGAATGVGSDRLTHPHYAVFRHQLAKQVNKGKAIAIELADLSAADRALVNINSTLLARKNGDPSGRFCLNLKKGHGSLAFNDAMDPSMAVEFPRFRPINCSHIAEMACKEVIPAQLRGLSAELLLLAIRRLHLAMLFGIFFLLRKSEFLDETPVRGAGGAAAAADGAAGAATSRTKKSTAQRRFVVFYDEANREIPYERIGITRASRIMFDVHRGKSDQFGKGRFNSHSRQASGTCLVTLMEEYFRDTRDKYKVKETDPIFQGGDLPRLTSDGLKQAMRLVAERLGLPADRISAHSLRYGGATLMASAGFPEFIIAQYGGWVEGSESLKVYIRPTRETIDSVSRHMASGGNATAEAELLMHVKSVHQIYLTSGAAAAA